MQLAKNKKLILSFLACLLIFVTTGYFLGTQYLRSQQQINVETRTIVTTINYDALVETFDTYEVNQTSSEITLEADKKVSVNFSELDNLNSSKAEETTNVHYSYRYDIEKNLIYMTTTFTELEEVVSSDTLIGKAFFDENGNLDAYFDIDGEIFLMSQMVDLSTMQNCGWFSNLFKKVIAAVVAVVVVAVVVAAVVATAGAGMAAVVAAGAIAGAVTGGVAGGLISYTEYGKLDWRWIVGGAVIGGVLGAVAGWGVGTVMGAGATSSTSTVKTLLDTAKNGKLDFSNSIKNKSYFQKGSADYRAYYEQANTISQEIMKAKTPIIESGTNYLKWTVEGVANSTKGVWELIIDPVNKTIVHFLFRT